MFLLLLLFVTQVERKKKTYISWFTPQKPTTAGTGLDQAQEVGTTSCQSGWQEPKDLCHYLLPASVNISRKLSSKQSQHFFFCKNPSHCTILDPIQNHLEVLCCIFEFYCRQLILVFVLLEEKILSNSPGIC